MTLQIGSTGDLVKQVQAFLGLTADGNFGPNTKTAVVAWQTKNGLTADGIVGPASLSKMELGVAAPVSSGPINYAALNGVLPTEVITLFPDNFAKYEINTKLRAAHFIAQIAHESDNFRIKTESLFYTTPQQLVNVWPGRFNLDGSNGKHNANDYIRNEQKLANVVYNGRMGNDQPNDGYIYRGGGFLQLTGKDSYKGYSTYLGKPLDVTANLLHTDNFYALDAALWEYAIADKLNLKADQGSTDDVVKQITRIINGGYVGLDKRTENFHKYFGLL